jgi:F-type H+-transporting ATPase subunit b
MAARECFAFASPDESEKAHMSLMDTSHLADGAATALAQPLPPLLAAVNVDLDKGVLIQMALFSVLIVILKPLLFDPMLRVFALREERTDGAKAEARAMQEKAADILANYERELSKVRAEASAERDVLRRETAELEASILSEARSAAELILSEGRERIQKEVAAYSAELDGREEELSARISSRVLGRELSA